ncbi:unnamed protein product [Brassica napus]|nr:unnamed protein product [Brassica napus]
MQLNSLLSPTRRWCLFRSTKSALGVVQNPVNHQVF